MVIIQLVFRENFGYMDEEKFRDNQIQYYAKKLRILESDNDGPLWPDPSSIDTE